MPPNCRFEVDDAEDEWNFSTKFDYIHGRGLVTCFKEPSIMIRQAFDALEPGGYLELQDAVLPFKFLGTPPTESSLYQWGKLVMEGAAKSGRPWDNVPNYKRWFEEIGFVSICRTHSHFISTFKWLLLCIIR